jgi:membrane associated rhomboid family serine protease
MIPFRDENPTVKTPIATYVLIGMNVFVWLAVQGFGSDPTLVQSFCSYALMPGDLLGLGNYSHVQLSADLSCELKSRPGLTTLFTSMFMHGGWLHIIGNMLFLWVFGDNVEDVMGPIRFILFYLLCGLAAAIAQIATDPSSLVPMIGASGAIGGVMGAYAILYPRARVHLLIILIFYVTTISVPAVLMLAYWFLLQVLSGIGSFGSGNGGVAIWAHIGGFAAGVGLVFIFRAPRLMQARARLTQRYSARHRWL